MRGYWSFSRMSCVARISCATSNECTGACINHTCAPRCVTVENTRCIFPFSYKNVTYNRCSNDMSPYRRWTPQELARFSVYPPPLLRSLQGWCATAVTVSGETLEWENCRRVPECVGCPKSHRWSNGRCVSTSFQYAMTDRRIRCNGDCILTDGGYTCDDCHGAKRQRCKPGRWNEISSRHVEG